MDRCRRDMWCLVEYLRVNVSRVYIYIWRGVNRQQDTGVGGTSSCCYCRVVVPMCGDF